MPTPNLQNQLSAAGYDLIDGPVRNHKPLQLWLKQSFNPAELYYENVLHAFKADVKLRLEKDPGMTVDDNLQSQFSFNIGLTLVKEIFQSMGLPPIELEEFFQSGKKVNIAFKNSQSEVVPLGKLIDFFDKADFLHPNPILMRNANRNHLIIISGIVSAEQLVVEFDADSKLSSKQLMALAKATSNKVDVVVSKSKKTRMTAGLGRMPIAVKAGRIDFDKGRFKGISLMTDLRDLF
jgi:hypothetical protein